MLSKLYHIVTSRSIFILPLQASGLSKNCRSSNCCSLLVTRNMSNICYTERVEKRYRHLFDISGSNVYDLDVIALSCGAPGPDLLKVCTENFEKATLHRMKYERENNCYIFQYGPNVGIPEFRQHLAKFLSEGYKSEVHPTDLVLTSGASCGLHQILSSLIDMSGVIFVDEVTYMIALTAMSQFNNMKLIPVPLNNDGIDTDALRSKIKEYRFETKTKMFWGMYYAIPVYHNPTGKLFSSQCLRELIKISREYDILIACDDVYNLLNYTNSPPIRLFQYDNMNDPDYKGNVISNGSFSKIMSPGIRLGWMECPPRCIEIFQESGTIKSGGALNNYTSGIMISLFQLGLAKEQLNLYLGQYRERMKLACHILKENLPESCKFETPTGGYFIWIEMPKHIDAADLNEFSKQNFKVFGLPGFIFSPIKEFKNCVRLTIGFHETPVIRDSVKRFCDAVKLYLSKN